MKKFVFKLDGLLKIKQAKEREVRHDLAEIQNLVDEKEMKISDNNQKVGEWAEYYNGVMLKGGDASQLAQIDFHIQKLYRYREQLEISLNVLVRKRDDVIEQYQQVQKEVRSIELIREKRYQEYRLELQQWESAQADEMAMMRYVRERLAS